MRLLDYGVNQLSQQGLSDARLCAEVLLSHVLKTDRAQVFRDFHQPVSDLDTHQYFEFIEGRKKGMPIAYLTGGKEFFSLPFHVSSSVLIPRPETETLVEEALSQLCHEKVPELKLCDVGTGSGIIAIVLKKYLPDAQITAIDIDQAALEVAKKNAHRHGMQIQFIRSDLLNEVKEFFDVIVANLPYIPSEEIDCLQKEVRNFEPRIALDGGQNGLTKIFQLIAQANSRLQKNGKLILEIGIGQAEVVSESMKEYDFSVQKIRKDLSQIPRVIVGIHR